MSDRMENANTEIERKFLTTSDGWRGADSVEKLVQGYLTPHANGAVVRVRVAGDRAFLTIKGREREGRERGVRDHARATSVPLEDSGRALEHAEYEYAIPKADAHEILETLARRPLIEKRRYRVTHGRHIWEVDEFAGANAGLVVAEVELESSDERPARPAWVGEEVTRDGRYTNSALSEHPFTLWQHDERSLVSRALQFAVHAHAGQVRKGTAVPYVTHPIRVAATLLALGGDARVAAAAYLHDTVEDTDTTDDELRAAFGEEVAALVAVASEPDKTASWKQRKGHTIKQLPTLSRRQLWVPLADKIDNAESIADDLDAAGDGNKSNVWGRFSSNASNQEWYYRALLDEFQASAHAEPEPGFDLLVSRLGRAVERAFDTVAAAGPRTPRRPRRPRIEG